MQPQPTTTRPGGAILAGGAGRRMGGAVKAGLVLGGETLLARATCRLAPQCAGLVVCAGPEPGRLAGLMPAGVACRADSVGGHAGPLAGLLAALDWAAETGHRDVLTVAVDTPFFPADLGARLAAGRGAARAALAADEDGLHPTFGLWEVGLAEVLRRALAEGDRKVTDFAASAGATTVPFAGRSAFFNINRPTDLAEAEARL
jgi:molybdopterin-guanine dinucleotide biosynthesis protein A